jgi:hypothetical protein
MFVNPTYDSNSVFSSPERSVCDGTPQPSKYTVLPLGPSGSTGPGSSLRSGSQTPMYPNQHCRHEQAHGSDGAPVDSPVACVQQQELVIPLDVALSPHLKGVIDATKVVSGRAADQECIQSQHSHGQYSAKLLPSHTLGAQSSVPIRAVRDDDSSEDQMHIGQHRILPGHSPLLERFLSTDQAHIAVNVDSSSDEAPDDALTPTAQPIISPTKLSAYKHSPSRSSVITGAVHEGEDGRQTPRGHAPRSTLDHLASLSHSISLAQDPHKPPSNASSPAVNQVCAPSDSFLTATLHLSDLAGDLPYVSRQWTCAHFFFDAVLHLLCIHSESIRCGRIRSQSPRNLCKCFVMTVTHVEMRVFMQRVRSRTANPQPLVFDAAQVCNSISPNDTASSPSQFLGPADGFSSLPALLQVQHASAESSPSKLAATLQTAACLQAQVAPSSSQPIPVTVSALSGTSCPGWTLAPSDWTVEEGHGLGSFMEGNSGRISRSSSAKVCTTHGPCSTQLSCNGMLCSDEALTRGCCKHMTRMEENLHCCRCPPARQVAQLQCRFGHSTCCRALTGLTPRRLLKTSDLTRLRQRCLRLQGRACQASACPI